MRAVDYWRSHRIHTRQYARYLWQSRHPSYEGCVLRLQGSLSNARQEGGFDCRCHQALHGRKINSNGFTPIARVRSSLHFATCTSRRTPVNLGYYRTMQSRNASCNMCWKELGLRCYEPGYPRASGSMHANITA